MENYKNVKLETYEWDSTWIEQTAVKDVPRVLYIGDSISKPTRDIAMRLMDGKVMFDGFATSKGIDNPYLCEMIRLFAEQEGGRNLVLFNNGLHGPHLNDETEYKHHYEKAVEYLLNYFKDTKIALILSTAQSNPSRDARVIKRNQAATEVGEKFNLPIIDFYTVSKSNPDLISSDGIHLTGEGYDLLAKKLVKEVTTLLNQ